MTNKIVCRRIYSLWRITFPDGRKSLAATYECALAVIRSYLAKYDDKAGQ